MWKPLDLLLYLKYFQIPKANAKIEAILLSDIELYLEVFYNRGVLEEQEEVAGWKLGQDNQMSDKQLISSLDNMPLDEAIDFFEIPEKFYLEDF